MITKPRPGCRFNRDHPLAKGLKACWLMNEAGGLILYDLSGNGNDGTLTNVAVPPTAASGRNPGQDGPTVVFDGSNDYALCGNKASLKGWPGITVATRVRPFSGFDGGLWGLVTKHKAGSNTDGSWNLRSGSTNSTFSFSDYGGGSTDTRLYQNGILDNSDTNWDVNGVLAMVAGNSYSIAATAKYSANLIGNSALQVGIGFLEFNSGGSPVYFWKGAIDYVYMWDRALSAKEVMGLHINPYEMFDPEINGNYDYLTMVPATRSSYLPNFVKHYESLRRE